MQNNNNYYSYPNAEFPYNYTKNGQKALKEKYINQENNQVNTMSNNTYQNNNATINNKEQAENVNAFNNNANLDISKLLPLLLNKNLQTNDLLDVLLPMLNKSNLPIKDLLNTKNKSTETADPLPIKEPISINGYKRVE